MVPIEALVAQIRARLAHLRDVELSEGLREEFKSASATVLAVNDSGQFVAGTPKALALTGYSLPELLTKTLSDLTPLPSIDDGRELWETFVASGWQRGTYELHTRNGALVTVRYSAVANVIPGIHLSFLEPERARGEA